MIRFPNAKINLGLDIVRRRDDGYHDISTVFYPIQLVDSLEIVKSSGSASTLTVLGNKVDCPMEKNLVMKACRLLESEFALPPVDIWLVKHIPDGAGLGGGSSDAAFTLVMLNEMFGLGLDKAQLACRAATLGADCAFFVYNEPMAASGIGDILSPAKVSLKGKALVLVKPEVSVPTKLAYSKVKPAEPSVGVEEILAMDTAQWKLLLKNDFEPSVFAEYPVVAEIKAKMYELGAEYASMSGSGSSVFGIFGSDNMAESVKNAFSSHFGNVFAISLDR